MSEFLKVKSHQETLSIIEAVTPLAVEMVSLDSACGRILAAPVIPPESVPHFPRATMDGYAVRARDTFGASEALPALLEVSGEIAMGEETTLGLQPGKAIAIPTGGMLPAGADAVVMVEYTSPLDESTIEVTRPVAPGDNVLQAGEDIAAGGVLFEAGRAMRPQDVGALAALGITSVSVYRRPNVGLISTGDEIVPVDAPHIAPGQIRDINSYSLAAQVREAGAFVGARATVADDLEALVETCSTMLSHLDMIIVSGGSSVGARDYTIRIHEYFPESELLIHGVAIRPGKPTILARIGSKMLWGLPGQPVSAMMVFTAFVRRSLQRLQGLAALEPPGRAVRAILSQKLPSVHGRTDYIPVVLSTASAAPVARPLFGKSAMISMLARSDGYVVIPEHVEGLDGGTEVTVHPFYR